MLNNAMLQCKDGDWGFKIATQFQLKPTLESSHTKNLFYSISRNVERLWIRIRATVKRRGGSYPRSPRGSSFIKRGSVARIAHAGRPASASSSSCSSIIFSTPSSVYRLRCAPHTLPPVHWWRRIPWVVVAWRLHLRQWWWHSCTTKHIHTFILSFILAPLALGAKTKTKTKCSYQCSREQETALHSSHGPPRP